MLKLVILTISNLLLIQALTIKLPVKESLDLQFYEEPADTYYLTKSQPAILKCKIENARTGFFKCNSQWIQDHSSSKIIQIGNKQILTIDLAITKSQLDEYKKSHAQSSAFWCTCQGWLNSADDTIISQKSYIKLAYLGQNFDWEPMPTSGLIGKSVEIRCLPPEGEPKPNVYWLKNNQPIEKSNKRVLVSHEGSLLINEVRLTDAANYTCVAENLAGRRLSDPAQLTVTENLGWSEWSNWTECSSLATSQHKCGEGTQKRYRTCLNPPTINNAIGCDGFPEQTIACYAPCNNKDDGLIVVLKSKSEKKSTSTTERNNYMDSEDDLNEDVSNSNDNNMNLGQLVYQWAQWHSWSMVCNSDCLRSRRRDCKQGYLKNGRVIALSDDKQDAIENINKCPGSEIEFGNCTFHCEKIQNNPKSNTVAIKTNSIQEDKTAQALIFSLSIISIIVLTILIFYFVAKCRRASDKGKELPSETTSPIYFSVQPDYNQDSGYMDVCTLLPQNSNILNNQMMSSDYHPFNETTRTFQFLKSNNGTSLTASSDERCDASRSSTATTTTSSGTGSNTTSPTDSLVKNSYKLMKNNSVSHVKSCSCCNNHHGNNVVMDLMASCCEQEFMNNENNSNLIMKLINEHKSCVCTSKCIINDSNYDIYLFNLYKSGGMIEIPKYSTHILVPDDSMIDELQAGIFKTNDKNLLKLDNNKTVLSSIMYVKSTESNYLSKPIILSFDHSAQFVESDWDTFIYYKNFNGSHFEEIDQNKDVNLYSQVVANRCYVMTERDGMYILVGSPKCLTTTRHTVAAVKEMKYAILLLNGAIKIYLIQNTSGALELLNEEIQKTNGKIIKIPDCFEIAYPRKSKIDATYLNLELNIIYNNLVMNSDSTCRKIRFSDIWNSSSDFIEIEIPVTINNKNNNNTNTFDLKVSVDFEEKLLFSYTNINTTIHELHTANCNQQEFYSSVSVTPVFIPIKINNLLDDFVLKCFKMNTLRRNDWRLFANLLKCDRNVQYFANKENSFELIISLWLMINISRSNDEDSSAINLINK